MIETFQKETYTYKTSYLLLIFLIFTACAGSKSPKKIREEKISLIIQTARSFTGTPYKWGGTTRAGMDCSGLLYNSFLVAGLELPRTSGEQKKIGKNVSIYELRPGDLVFFAAGKGRKITHVGMVTEVNNRKNVQFIHASTKLGVVENNIFSDYYRRIFVKARRPF
ncbi:MAG: C40 family peptidase [Candidatus Cyclobacteriaceae bacterium M3_2C_046]